MRIQIRILCFLLLHECQVAYVFYSITLYHLNLVTSRLKGRFFGLVVPDATLVDPKQGTGISISDRYPTSIEGNL